MKWLKGTLLLTAVLIFFAANAAHSQTLQAVNDTIDLVPGITVTVDLLSNDTVPPGDSIRVMGVSTGSGWIQKTLVSGGTYTFLAPHWGCPGIFTGSYVLRDFTLNEISNAALIFRIRDHSVDSLYLNNVSAAFAAFGNHFQNPPDGSVSHFIVPKGSGRSTIFCNSFWIGGTGDDGLLYLAAERYRQGPVVGPAGLSPDYWAGPVMDSINYSAVQDTVWNRVWNLKKSDIEYHKAHWQDAGYVPIRDILTWPGNGDVQLGEAPILAPFYDRNGDGTYNPYDGDYPAIRGDQALYFIFNDDRSAHLETYGNRMKAEIHGMAYEYDIPTDSAFNNTVFVNYEIYNRSQRTYSNTYIGVFTDLDIGSAVDDYVGCDVQRGSYFGYNGDPVDGDGLPPSYGDHPPAQAVTILAGPYLDPDDLDNPSKDNLGHQLCNESVNGTGFGDGITDNERMGMREFNFTFNTSAGFPVWATDPDYAPDYYRMMQGYWKDSTHIIYGGEGHSSAGGYGPACNFMFPGNSDTLNWGVGCVPPNGPEYWTEKTAGNVPSDRRGLASMGPFTFHPGDVQELDFAFVFARDYTGNDSLPSVTLLGNRIDVIRNAYISGVLPNGQSFLGIHDHPGASGNSFTLYPNPATSTVTIRFESMPKDPVGITITDLEGRTVLQKSIGSGTLQSSLDVSTIPSGLYLVRLTGSGGDSVQKISIVR